MSDAVILLVAFFGFLIVGVPVAACLGIAATLVIVTSGIPIALVAQRLAASIDSFTLVAVPLFIFAGDIMATGGIARRLVRLSLAVVGWMRGGLAAANVLASMVFGGISGSAGADIAAIGPVLVPAMKKEGYPEPYACAVTAASSTLGIIIPPSIPMVLLSATTGMSLIGLFLAGYIPGLIIASTLIGFAVIRATILGEGERRTFSFGELWHATSDAIWAVMAPVIIVGGIIFGVFTPTEAAAVGVIYAAIVSLVIYREMSLADLFRTATKSIVTTGVIVFIFACASLFAYVLTRAQVPQHIVELIASVSSEYWVQLLIINLFLLVIGMFLDPAAAIITLAPVLMPIAANLGMDPVHFGLMVIVNLAIGLITPPVGFGLFVAKAISGSSLRTISVSAIPFAVLMIAVLMLIAFVPAIVTVLPNLVLR
jgi:tripartite ATP-independent transporter DctM subunit